jgi:hypothetical protein
LRTLAAELRADIEELVQTAVPELVFDIGADYSGGVFGAEGQGLAFPLTRTEIFVRDLPGVQRCCRSSILFSPI